jgi:hypothetical protein
LDEEAGFTMTSPHLRASAGAAADFSLATTVCLGFGKEAI